MTKKKRATAAATAIVAASLLFAGSFAWVSTLQTATNKFRQNDYNVQLHDVFEGKEVVTNDSETGEYTSEIMEWKPNESNEKVLSKKVWVTNNGSGNILIRVKLSEDLSVINQGVTLKKSCVTKFTGMGESKAYDYNTAPIREKVEWKIGNDEWSKSPTILSYDEWNSITDPTKKVGPFWVMDTSSNLLWMEPLKASDPSVAAEPLATGNTALLLESVKLKDAVEGHVDYSIKVEMDAIDADLVGLSQEGSTWAAGGHIRNLALAAASAEKVKSLETKRNAIENTSVKSLYNEAINAALEGKSDEEIAELEAQAEALQEAITKDPTYDQPVITQNEGSGDYLLNGAAIDTKMAEWLATKCGRANATELTKADLVSVRSISITNQGVESFAGLTSEYFPNLTSIYLAEEAGIVVDTSDGVNVDELNAMDDSIKKQLESLTLHNCSGIKGDVDVSGFEKLELLVLSNCSNLEAVTKLTPSLNGLNLQLSKIKTLDVSQCTQLKELNMWRCESLGMDGGGITGLENLINLKFVNITQTKLTNLDLGKADDLITLSASNCAQLKTLKLSEKAFTKVDSNYPVLLAIKGGSALGSEAEVLFDISKMTLITTLDVTGCGSNLKIKKRANQTITPDTFTNVEIAE